MQRQQRQHLHEHLTPTQLKCLQIGMYATLVDGTSTNGTPAAHAHKIGAKLDTRKASRGKTGMDIRQQGIGRARKGNTKHNSLSPDMEGRLIVWI